jgi:hypothetical protein
MAYDPVRQRVLLFGGYDATNRHLADTWEWDGNHWTQQAPAPSPSARSGHAMVHQDARQRLMLFGGQVWPNGSLLADTWEWDGSQWEQRMPPTTPPAQRSHAMTFDSARQRVVSFGAGTWLFGTVQPAAAQAIGRACSGSNGPPVLTSNEPYLGNPAVRLQLLSARATAPVLFALATGPDNLDLGGGCRLYVSGDLVPLFAVTNGFGFAESAPLSIPLDLALLGALAYAQAVVADPRGPVSGLAFSAGRQLVIGD